MSIPKAATGELARVPAVLAVFGIAKPAV